MLCAPLKSVPGEGLGNSLSSDYLPKTKEDFKRLKRYRSLSGEIWWTSTKSWKRIQHLFLSSQWFHVDLILGFFHKDS